MFAAWLYLGNDERARGSGDRRGHRQRLADFHLYTPSLQDDLRAVGFLDATEQRLSAEVQGRFSHRVVALLVLELEKFVEDPPVNIMTVLRLGQRIQTQYWGRLYENQEERQYYLSLCVRAVFKTTLPQPAWASSEAALGDGIPRTHIFTMSHSSAESALQQLPEHFREWCRIQGHSVVGLQAGDAEPLLPRLGLRVPVPFGLLLQDSRWSHVFLPWDLGIRSGRRFGYHLLRKVFGQQLMVHWRQLQQDLEAAPAGAYSRAAAPTLPSHFVLSHLCRFLFLSLYLINDSYSQI